MIISPAAAAAAEPRPAAAEVAENSTEAARACSLQEDWRNNTIQYNTSWGTETPPGTSLQANFVAHGRSNIVRNLCDCTIPYPLLRHSACGAPVTPRGSDMYPNTLWVGAAVDGVEQQVGY